MLEKSQSLTFTVTVDVQSTLIIEGLNIIATSNGSELEPSNDGYDVFLDAGETFVFTVTSTNENAREDITISCYPLEQSEY